VVKQPFVVILLSDRTVEKLKMHILELDSASEMTYIVSGGALNSTHSLFRIEV